MMSPENQELMYAEMTEMTGIAAAPLLLNDEDFAQFAADEVDEYEEAMLDEEFIRGGGA